MLKLQLTGPPPRVRWPCRLEGKTVQNDKFYLSSKVLDQAACQVPEQLVRDQDMKIKGHRFPCDQFADGNPGKLGLHAPHLLLLMQTSDVSLSIPFPLRIVRHFLPAFQPLLCPGEEQTPENIPQLDPETSLLQSPDLDIPPLDPAAIPLSKSGMPPLVRLQACVGALPSKAASQACLAVIRQVSGASVLLPVMLSQKLFSSMAWLS